jgi:hypothetical protein
MRIRANRNRILLASALSRKTRKPLVRSGLYEIVGIGCGFGLLNYGFTLIATGVTGTRQLTSQFLGVNLLVGGSVAVFISLYFLLKSPMQVTLPIQPAGSAPNVGVKPVVEEEPPSLYGFYKNIEHVGYLITALGLFSAVDLVLQVFIPRLYNEARWWVEVLLAIFGVLSYAIFGSIGRLGAQEEKTYPSTVQNVSPAPSVAPNEATQPVSTSDPQTLEVRINEFTQSGSGEYERQLAGTVYDLFRVDRDTIIVWRENRQGMRTQYLAGPYELSKQLMEEYVIRGEELRIGRLSLSVETLRDLMRLQKPAAKGLQTPAN